MEAAFVRLLTQRPEFAPHGDAFRFGLRAKPSRGREPSTHSVVMICTDALDMIPSSSSFFLLPVLRSGSEVRCRGPLCVEEM